MFEPRLNSAGEQRISACGRNRHRSPKRPRGPGARPNIPGSAASEPGKHVPGSRMQFRGGCRKTEPENGWNPACHFSRCRKGGGRQLRIAVQNPDFAADRIEIGISWECVRVRCTSAQPDHMCVRKTRSTRSHASASHGMRVHVEQLFAFSDIERSAEDKLTSRVTAEEERRRPATSPLKAENQRSGLPIEETSKPKADDQKRVHGGSKRKFPAQPARQSRFRSARRRCRLRLSRHG